MSENERLAKLEEQVKSHEKEICSIASDVREIKDKLLQRPSWTVMLMLTSLITLCSVLLTLILK